MMETAPARVADLIREGRKIEAVKAVREETGASLKDALQAVEEMERVGQTADPMPEVEALARDGRTAEAIALLRQRSGLGLKEAKDVVDALPGPEAETAPRAALAVVIGVAIVLVAVLVLLLAA